MKYKVRYMSGVFDGGSPQHVTVPSGRRFTFHADDTPELELTEQQVKELDSAGFICEPVRAAVTQPATTRRRRRRKKKATKSSPAPLLESEASATEEE